MSLINTVSLPKLGNMTGGSGLGAIFDGQSSIGYHTGTSGWAGVTFLAPTKVDKVIAKSASNGFDASGSTSQITLTLRGKVGSAPSNSADGVALATLTFTDVNQENSKVLTSNDQTTEFDHCWVQCQTGVWAVFSELEFYQVAVVTTIPQPVLLNSTAPTSMQKSCMEVVPLPQAIVRIPQFDIYCEVPKAGLFDIDYAINVTHRGELLPTPYWGAVGVGAAIYYQFSTTLEGLENAPLLLTDISSSNGINIDDRNPAHYANLGMITSMKAEKGFYRFGLFMTGHTDGTSQDYVAAILAEQGRGLNGFRVSYNPDGIYLNMNDYAESST